MSVLLPLHVVVSGRPLDNARSLTEARRLWPPNLTGACCCRGADASRRHAAVLGSRARLVRTFPRRRQHRPGGSACRVFSFAGRHDLDRPSDRHLLRTPRLVPAALQRARPPRPPYVALDATRHRYDATNGDGTEFGLVFNRMSPSAYLRGRGDSILYTLNYLAHLEQLGVRVVNGLSAFRVRHRRRCSCRC